MIYAIEDSYLWNKKVIFAGWNIKEYFFQFPIENIMMRNMNVRKPADDKKYLQIYKEKGPLTAVKEYREDTGCSLREAKEYIDSLKTEFGLKQPLSGGGCMLVFMLLMTVAFSFMLF